MHSQLRGHPFAQLQSVIHVPTTLILSWRHSYTRNTAPHITPRQCHLLAHSHIHTALQANTCPLQVCHVCPGQFVQDKHLPILVFWSVLPRTEPVADSLVCREWEIGLLWPKIIGHQVLTLELSVQKPIPAGA